MKQLTISNKTHKGNPIGNLSIVTINENLEIIPNL